MNSRYHCFLVVIAAAASLSCRTHSLTEVSSGAGRKPFYGIPSRNLTNECVQDYRVGVDYFPDKTTIRYAKNFELQYHPTYKVLRMQLERGARSGSRVTDTVVLIQCGTPPPVLKGELTGATVVVVPATTAASNENSDIAAIAQLGFANRLVAVGGSRVYNAEVRRLWDQKRLAAIGYAWHGLPSSEVLLLKRPDVVFMRRATLEQGTSLSRARRLGISAVPTLARYEQHYLGMAEWVKVFAAFFNAERDADRFFDEVTDRCENVIRTARAAQNRPLAIWAGRDRGAWSVARSPRDYRTQYIADAGAINPLYKADAKPVAFVRDEQLIAMAASAEYWISDNMSPRGWPAPHLLQRISAWRLGNVFHHEKRSDHSLRIYDWYETGFLRPDLVLEDLLRLFHPGTASSGKIAFFEKMPR